jgi:hypothetical protein
MVQLIYLKTVQLPADCKWALPVYRLQPSGVISIVPKGKIIKKEGTYSYLVGMKTRMFSTVLLILFFCLSSAFKGYGQGGLVKSAGEEGVLRTRGTAFGPYAISVSYDTATIYHDKYYAIYRSDEELLYVVSGKREIILKQRGMSPNIVFIDFNEDGFKDIVVTYKSDAPDAKALLLFDYKSENFKLVNGFDAFAEPVLITGTSLYYSYAPAGCASFDWNSDLFYVKDYKAIKTGSMSVNQCPNSEAENGIYIRKLKEGQMELEEKIPLTVFAKYPDGKWGFLTDYWSKNHKKFKH